MKIFAWPLRIFPLLLALLTGGCSPEPVPDHSGVPGTLIAYSPASSGVYLGSPGIAVLPGGEYVASLDYFGPSTDMTTNAIYGSVDQGETWRKLTEVKGQFWSTLFFHKDALYLLGTSRRYGAVVIRRSTDGGETWTAPVDASSGVLIADSMYHCAPVPLLVYGGRLWKGFEKQTGEWPSGFRPFVLSAPADADLLDAGNWRVSQSIPWDDWQPYGGWLEGNVVQTPDGKLVDILRVHEMKRGGRAAMVQISDGGRRVSFDPESGFIDFPGGCKKFTIRHDPESNSYWSLTNWVHPDDEGGNAERTRNTVALISSKDLKEWSTRTVVLRSLDAEKTGFQYIDWLFEGEDIIAVSRTAFDDGLGGAHNQHDANYITFHRIEGFRSLGK
jgi:hypothetical protein